jgi:hypothetical protein
MLEGSQAAKLKQPSPYLPLEQVLELLLGKSNNAL